MSEVYRTSSEHGTFGCRLEVIGEGIGANAPRLVTVEGAGCGNPLYQPGNGNITGFATGRSAEVVATSINNFHSEHESSVQTVDERLELKAPVLGSLVLMDGLANDVERTLSPDEAAITEIETGFMARVTEKA